MPAPETPIPPGDEPAPLLQAVGLTRRFHGRTAVEALDFSIRRGEVVGFLGPNGAGKTTTMRMITGYLPPTAGTAIVAGFDVAVDPVKVRRHIGYLPENMPLYTEMRVKEYLHFRAQLKGLKGKPMRERVGEVMATCSLTDVRRRLIGNLSKGYRQRIGLADALVHQPDLLILDEPTNGLDPNQIRQAREFIRSLAGRHTILLSTHILAEVEQTCDRVIILDEGRIRAVDSPANLIRNLRMAGLIVVEIQCPGPGRAVEEFGRIAGIRNVSEPELLEDGWYSLVLRSESGSDPRPTIVDCARRHNWSLREVHQQPPRLEDVFFELTQPRHR